MHTHAYIHTYIHTYIDTYIHTYIHTYIYPYIHIHTHTCVHTNLNTHYIHTRFRDRNFPGTRTKKKKKVIQFSQGRPLIGLSYRSITVLLLPLLFQIASHIL